MALDLQGGGRDVNGAIEGQHVRTRPFLAPVAAVALDTAALVRPNTAATILTPNGATVCYVKIYKIMPL